MATTPTPRLIEPPFYDPPLAPSGSGQQHSQAWTEYHQAVADRLAVLNSVGTGVVDGSEAVAGAVGEFLTGGSGAIGLVNNAVTNLASVALTPGDWDVSGFVAFSAGAGTHTYFGVGIGVVDTSISATYPGTAINQVLPTTVHRYNITAAATVWVVAQAGFTGTVTASGSIRARRAR
jgi:hypothetical protein